MDAASPSVTERQLARLEYVAMAAAAHYCDIGMELPNGYDTDRMLMPTRSPEDPAPLHIGGPQPRRRDAGPHG